MVIVGRRTSRRHGSPLASRARPAGGRGGAEGHQRSLLSLAHRSAIDAPDGHRHGTRRHSKPRASAYTFFPFPFLPLDRRLFLPTAMAAAARRERRARAGRHRARTVSADRRRGGRYMIRRRCCGRRVAAPGGRLEAGTGRPLAARSWTLWFGSACSFQRYGKGIRCGQSNGLAKERINIQRSVTRHRPARVAGQPPPPIKMSSNLNNLWHLTEHGSRQLIRQTSIPSASIPKHTDMCTITLRASRWRQYGNK